jgi:phage protein D/phage baseplate assembly protein gpV
MADTENLISHFYIEVQGMDKSIGVELMADLVEASVESSLHLPDVATIILHDAKLRWIDDAMLEPGKGLKISAKASQGEHPIFDGEIVEIEPDFRVAGQRLTVRAFDRLHRLSRGRHVRSFLNVSDGDLVQQIAREASLQAKVGPTSQIHPYVFQNNETNLEFLQHRAASLGFVLFADGNKINFVEPEKDPEPIDLKWGETLKEFRPRMTTVAQVTDTTVRGWDPVNRQPIIGQVKNGKGAPDVGESRSGGQMAKDAFKMEAPHLVADRPIRTQGEADKLAQAIANRSASRFVEADGTCLGNSKIIAGTSIKLNNVGKRFNGDYLITSARHIHTAAEGYVTQFTVSGHSAATLLSVLTPESNGKPTGGLVIGIVTDNADPDGGGRVKVKYPWLSPDHASDWARVVSAGGGNQRGIEFLPEINDEVLVGFEQGDVHHPYVLGGLWNGQDKPPADKSKAVSGGKVQQRVIRSRAGHTITLDDNDGAGGITIADKNGNSILIDSGSNKLEITMQGDVEVKSQGKMSFKAQGPVEISGMGVKIDGGASTVDVKGSVINLN